MVEVLMTMLLVTVSTMGLAALQISTIRQVTNSKRVGEATRLAQLLVGRYKSMQYGNLVPTGGSFATVLRKDGATSMQDVGPDGESDGPFTAQVMVESVGGGMLVTVRVSWLRASALGGTTPENTGMSAVILTLQRYP
jgi:hypothetical protein